MRKYKILIHAAVAAFAIGVTVFIMTPDRPEGTIDIFDSAGPSIGAPDDPNARHTYEFELLRDPETNQIPAGIRRRELAFAATLPSAESHALAKSGGASLQTLEWTQRGPVNVSGRTRAIAIDVADENILLAGGVSGGMWRSTDQGTSWTKTSKPSDIHSVTSVVQDTRPGFTHIWYYSTGELLGNSASAIGAYFSGDGVFKSTDGGVSWEPLASTVSGTADVVNHPFDGTWRVVCDPNAEGPGTVYIASADGIYRSSDGGETWNRELGSGLSRSYYADVVISRESVLYATLSSDGSRGGIWRSTNGLDWTNIISDEFPRSFNRIVGGIAPSNENTVYFLAHTPGAAFNGVAFAKYTYISGDGSGDGGVWDMRWQNLPALAGRGTVNPQGSYNMVVAVHPQDENTVFIGGTTLFRSTDGFASTLNTTRIGGFFPTLGRYRDYPNHHPDQHALLFFPSDPNMMLSSNDAGVSLTRNNVADQVEWESLNNGYTTTQFYTIAIDRKTIGSEFIIGGLQDRGTWYTQTNAPGLPWKRMRGADGAYCAITEGGTDVYISIQNGQIVRFTLDENGDKIDSTRVDPTDGVGYKFINPFALDPLDEDVMYVAGGEYVWRNSDVRAIPLGSNTTTKQNWTRLPNSLVDRGTISAISVSSAPADRIYYATDRGQVLRLDNAHEPQSTPVDLTAGKGMPQSANVNCVAIDPLNGDRILLVFSNYNTRSLFWSTDAGDTWTDVSGNLEESPTGVGSGPSTRWAVVLPVEDETHVFVATSVGLFSTTALQGAETVWVREGTSVIGNVVTTMIDARPSDGFIAVSTHGGGIYSSDNLLGLPAGARESARTNDITTLTIAPNPAVHIATLTFDLRREVSSRIEIVDMQGRAVLRVDNGLLPAGRHNVQIQTSALPQGAYMARVLTEDGMMSTRLRVRR